MRGVSFTGDWIVDVQKFVVNEEPYACWDWELREKNIEFLEGIDATYYKYIAKINSENIDKEDRHRAALSLRLAYSQGLETLFSLICSAIQAPHCSVGWLLSYQNCELIKIVNNVHMRKRIFSRFKDKNISWKIFSKYVHSNFDYSSEKISWIQDGFGLLWTRFANDFLDKGFSQEYNSAKHGLRTKLGGFSISIGEEEVRGTPAPPEKMVSLGGSEFGTSYFTIEKIIDDKKTHFRPRRQSRNWQPENLISGLCLISMSINNVISFLRILNGIDPAKCLFENPDSKDAFNLPWGKTVGVNSSSMDTVVKCSDIVPCSKESILNSYEDNTKKT